VLVDSGAFANFNKGHDVVTLDAYADWLAQHGKRCWRYFNLDRITDPDGSRANLEQMRARGLDPVPVFQRGGKIAELRELVEHNRLVAIGGVAARLTGDRDYIDQVMHVVGERRDRIHLLGVGVIKLLYRYRPYSADASTHSSRHGLVRFWDSQRARLAQLRRTEHQGVIFDNRPIGQQRARFARICDEYGIDPDEVQERLFYTGKKSRIINLRSFMRYQAQLRRLGTEYFLAIVSTDIELLPEAWDLERDQGGDDAPHLHAAA
jgi:hypothetical protein